MSPDESFGARFLAALRTQFKTTASLSYAVVEEVAQADRETFLAILFGRPEVPEEFLRLARTEEPEVLARRLVEMQADVRKEHESATAREFLGEVLKIFFRFGH